MCQILFASLELHFTCAYVESLLILTSIYFLDSSTDFSVEFDRKVFFKGSVSWDFFPQFYSWLRFSVSDPDPYWFWSAGSGSGSRRATMTQKNRKKGKHFKFWSARYSLLGLDVLYGGLGISKLQFLIKKHEFFFSCNFFKISAWKPWIWIRIRIRIRIRIYLKC
jgi:hypothetical protein